MSFLNRVCETELYLLPYVLNIAIDHSRESNNEEQATRFEDAKQYRNTSWFFCAVNIASAIGIKVISKSNQISGKDPISGFAQKALIGLSVASFIGSAMSAVEFHNRLHPEQN